MDRIDPQPQQPTPGAPRLRPAHLRSQKIHIECPTWCTRDHIEANVGYLEDIDHALTSSTAVNR